MTKKLHIIALASAGLLLAPTLQAASFTDALTGGKPTLNMRLRMETVTQDGKQDDASALTVRTRLGYLTGDFSGFKIFGEMTNTSSLGDQNFLVPKGPGANGNTSYPVVADPDLSRINQAWVSYSGLSDTAVKVGRQRVILDNARFVGNVGWRQTEQVYDALVLSNKSIENLTLTYGYVDRAYNIFGMETPSASHLLNVNYSGLPFAKITGYAYLLDLNNDSPAGDSQTVGIRLGGKQALGDFSLLYALEYAKQSDYADAGSNVDADYTKIELGGKVMGVTAKIGQETLGGDGTYGFQTVLATKHAFNGWADKFLATPAKGLVDSYLALVGKPAGVKLLGVYHKFSSDEGSDNYGTELDLLAAKKFSKNYSAGIKYASYKEDGFATDTDKVWVWGQMRF